MNLLSIFGFICLVASPTDHYEDIEKGAVFFKMTSNGFAVGDSLILKAEISGKWISEDDNGYKVLIKRRLEKKNKVEIDDREFYIPLSRIGNPLQDGVLRAILERKIETAPKNPPVDPCYNPWFAYSMWIRSDGELKKIETANCGGDAPFITPKNPADLEQLKLIRDQLLVLAASELVQASK